MCVRVSKDFCMCEYELRSLTILIDDTGPMLFTYMSTSMTVGLTASKINKTFDI